MTCFGVPRAFQHPDVCIGWYPYATIRESVIRTAPNGGYVLKTVPKFGGIGVQSVRNPRAEANPARRPPQLGWVWCYSRATGDTGWISEADILVDDAADDKPALRGPGGYDFDCTRPAADGRIGPRPKKPNGCGSLSQSKPLRRVRARTATLRYSGRSERAAG